MAKQTSTQWLQEALELHLTEEQKSQFLGLFLQSQDMNREEIEDAYQEGKWDWYNHITNGTESKDLAQYYNETYNNPE